MAAHQAISGVPAVQPGAPCRERALSLELVGEERTATELEEEFMGSRRTGLEQRP
jgi:hypothetical protein